MKKLLSSVTSISFILVLLAACGTPLETPTTILTTATRVPPTLTPVPPTATPEPPDRILFIGNSLTFQNFGIDTHIKELAASANPPLTIETSNATSGGATLEQLWDYGWPLDAIREGTWDVVVLQEYFEVMENDEQKFYEYTRNFDEEIKKVGTQTVLYMTWERDVKNPTATIEEIAHAHSHIGAELGVKVAPVGLAWQRSIQERPDLNLYDSDRLHPSARGTYLATCVLYATILGQSPVGLSYQPVDMLAEVDSLEWKREQWQMTEDEVAFLQRIAWETVVDYQAQ